MSYKINTFLGTQCNFDIQYDTVVNRELCISRDSCEDLICDRAELTSLMLCTTVHAEISEHNIIIIFL